MALVAGTLASLPSPSSGTLEIGPLSIHAYGLMIALGFLIGLPLALLGTGLTIWWRRRRA